MRIPWRALFLLGAIALGAMVFFIVRSNLRSGGFVDAVQANDASAVRRYLTTRPDLVTTPIMPQGSRSTSGRRRWRGRTAMHYLVSGTDGESIGVADAFRDAGADFKVRLEGDTLLHLAAAAGDVKMVTWLLAHGADITARNGCEHPAEALCPSGQFADWQPFDRRRANGIVCSGCDHDGQTALHAAQRSSHAYEVSGLLLARGADVGAVDAAGRTALHSAAQEARASQDPRVLCAHGADPAIRDRNGKLPADLAREADEAKTVGRYSATGAGELAGWLAPGGGCASVAARARPGAPVPPDDVDAAWRVYVCSRAPKSCGT